VARPPVRDGKRPADTSPTIGPRIFAVDVDDGTLTSIPELGWDSWSFVYSPDGSQVAYVGSSAGSRQLFLMTADSTVPQQLTHDAFAAEDPTWSPDGSSIAYTGFDRSGTRQIFVIGADGGTARMVTKEPHDARNPSWSPPGDRIAYVTSHPGHAAGGLPGEPGDVGFVRTVDPSTGVTTTLFRDRDGQNWVPDWSPDGEMLTFQRHGLDHAKRPEIWQLDLRTGEVSRLFGGPEQMTAVALWSPDGTRIAHSDFDGVRWNTFVLNVATGEDRMVVPDATPDSWRDDHTLIVET
jgi:TolB protein